MKLLSRSMSCSLLLSLSLLSLPAYCDTIYTPCKIMGFWRDCINVEIADSTADDEEKQFISPSENKAKIYLLRSGSVAAKLKTDIYIDHHFMAALAPDTYLSFEVSPGKHVLRTTTFHDIETEWDFKRGETYFFEIALGIFFYQKNERLSPETKEAGQEKLHKLRLVKISD